MIDSNSNHSDQLNALESNIKRANTLVEFGAAIDRIRSNRDFKKVISEGYFEQEAIRLVQLKADPAMQRPESQEAIVKQIDAIGALAQFFNTKTYQSNLAKRSISADEETIEEMLKEGLQ